MSNEPAPPPLSSSIERKLVAILSADVKGYSRLMSEDEVATVRVLTAYRQVIATLVRQYRGRVVDSPGDNLLAEFTSVVDAVQCAVKIQQELKIKNTELPDSRTMVFRIGINLGDVVVEGERIYGDGINIAARLEGLAEGGGICISGTVYDQIENKLALDYEDMGEQTVKNIAKPIRVYRVHLEPEGIPPQTGIERERQPLPKTKVALSDKPSLAVLPFTNMSGDPEQEYFSDGITEDLITDLSKLSALFVIARHSVFTYKGKAVKIEQVGKELGVRYVLEGSVRKAGNRVRITAQLIDTTTGYHLWAERYDRELRDIFAVQDEVTQQIVAALKVTLTAGEQQRLRHAPTDNLEAYDCYLRGLEYYARRSKTTMEQARQMFEQAVKLDPQFAAAYAFLGRTYLVERINQWNQDPQTLEKIIALGRQAVALDDTLPAAHETLGFAYLGKRRYEQAIDEAEKAVALDPNCADAYVTLAEISSCSGRPHEALGHVEKAMGLNPHYPPAYIFALGQAQYLLGRYGEAIAAFKRVLARNPDHVTAHGFLAVCYVCVGREEEARAEAAEVRRLSPTFSIAAVEQIVPYKDPIFAHHLDNLRKAGLQ